jgi:hypothetical protein
MPERMPVPGMARQRARRSKAEPGKETGEFGRAGVGTGTCRACLLAAGKTAPKGVD